MDRITKHLILLLVVLGISGIGYAVEPSPTDVNLRDLCYTNMLKCQMEISAIYMELGASSVIGEERLARMDDAVSRLVTPLGPKTLPYLTSVCQTWTWPGGAISGISKFQYHRVVLSREPKNLLSSTEEFPDLMERDVVPEPRAIYLRWWLEGEAKTPEWFMERYAKWMGCRRSGDTVEADAAYQKLRDIGIAAIPLWLTQLGRETDPSVQKSILEALPWLTDGGIQTNMTYGECMKWWEANKADWTIPFPESRDQFLDWLENEANSGLGAWALTSNIITISRVEDRKSVDILVRLLEHPKPEGRQASMEQLQKLLGEQMPAKYVLVTGAGDWSTLSDLVEAGKDDTARKTLKAWNEKMADPGEAASVARDLSAWWQDMRDDPNFKLHWDRAWQSLR
ncbi:MAG: hypothetical protein ACYC2Y_11040 [Armatimonadota bacterium]